MIALFLLLINLLIGCICVVRGDQLIVESRRANDRDLENSVANGQ